MRYRATVDVDVIFLLNSCGQSENWFIFSFVSTLRQSRFSLLFTALTALNYHNKVKSKNCKPIWEQAPIFLQKRPVRV